MYVSYFVLGFGLVAAVVGVVLYNKSAGSVATITALRKKLAQQGEELKEARRVMAHLNHEVRFRQEDWEEMVCHLFNINRENRENCPDLDELSFMSTVLGRIQMLKKAEGKLGHPHLEPKTEDEINDAPTPRQIGAAETWFGPAGERKRAQKHKENVDPLCLPGQNALPISTCGAS